MFYGFFSPDCSTVLAASLALSIGAKIGLGEFCTLGELPGDDVGWAAGDVLGVGED